MARSLTLSLSQNLTIAQVAELHEKMETLIAQAEHDSVVIDAHAVERTDTAGVQLLMAFVADAKQHGIKIRWAKSSGVIAEAAQTLGVSAWLDVH